MSLLGGFGIGWEKCDCDSELLVVDLVMGRMWVGFESVNVIWCYGFGFV